MNVDEFKNGIEMLDAAGVGAAKIDAFKSPRFAAGQVSHREIIAMAMVIRNLGLARPDLLPKRTKKDGAGAEPAGL